MLLRFRVNNHLSLRKTQELSLVASSLKDSGASLIAVPGSEDIRALPFAVIYGANASGKSNVVDAIAFMRRAVLRSHRDGTPGGGVPRTPFGLDNACQNKPSLFSADFIADGTRYHYEFSARDDAFTGEALHSFPQGRRQLLFERDRQSFVFGRALKGRNKVISELTRPNSLFVSAAAQNDHEELSKVANFFRNIIVHNSVRELEHYADRPYEDISRIVRFLADLGTGVCGYRATESTPFNDELREAIAAFNSVLSKRNAGTRTELPDKMHTIELSHVSEQGGPVFFELQRESTGTRRLLALLRPAMRVLERGGVLIVDEIDASVHTLACEAVIALFSSQAKNVAGAQLIATTHDTNLLRSPLLRRDQIWFTERGPTGATELYPLSDFHTRQGDNIEKGYLQGRYGAIPFAGSPSELIEKV